MARLGRTYSRPQSALRIPRIPDNSIRLTLTPAVIYVAPNTTELPVTTGLVARLDADIPTTVEADATGAVSQWTDPVSGFSVVQATQAKKPTSGATTRNGRNVIDFVRANAQVLAKTGISTTVTSVFAVFKFATVPGTSAPFGTDHAAFFYAIVTNGPINLFSDSGTGMASSNNQTTGTWYAAAEVVNGASSVIQFDGVTTVPGANPGVSVGATSLFVGDDSSTDYLDGSIGEILAYSDVKNAADRALILGYLDTKWNGVGNALGITPGAVTLALTPAAVSTGALPRSMGTWFPFDETSRITASGTDLTTITDAAPGSTFTGYGTQAGGGGHHPPQTGTRTANGKNVIDFIPANQSGFGVGTTAFNIGTVYTPAQPVTHFFVVATDVLDSAQHLLGVDAGSFGGTTLQLQSDNHWHMYAGNPNLDCGAADTSLHCIVAVFNGASSRLEIDGVVVASGSVGATGVAIWILGGQGAFDFWDGPLGEVATWPVALDTVQSKQVYRYANEKWLSSNLLGVSAAVSIALSPAVVASSAVATPISAAVSLALSPAVVGVTPKPWTTVEVLGFGYWDASDTATLHATASNVDLWDDKSGSGYGLAYAHGARVVTGTRTVLGLNVLDFPGNAALSIASVGTRAQPNTIILVFALDAGTAAATQVICDGYVSGHRHDIFYDGTGAGSLGLGAGTDRDATGWTFDTDVHVVVAEVNGASSVLRLDATALTLAGNPGTNDLSAGFQVGDFLDGTGGPGGAGLNGVLCAVAAYSGVLATSDRNNIEAFLLWQWKRAAVRPASTSNLLGITTGAVSIALAPAVVATSAVALTVSAAVSLSLGVASVASSAVALGITTAAPPITLALDPAVVATSAVALSLSLAVSVPLGVASVSVTAVALVVQFDQSVTLSPASTPVVAQTLVLSATVSLPLGVAAVPVAAQTLTLSAAISLTLSPASTVVTAVALTPSAAVSLALSPATAASSAVALVVAAAATLTLTPAVVATSAVALVVVFDQSVALSPASVAVTAVQLGIAGVAGNSDLPATPATVTVAAQTLVLASVNVSLALSPASVTTTALTLTLTPGAATPALSPAQTHVAAQSLLVAPGGVSLTLGVAAVPTAAQTLVLVVSAQLGASPAAVLANALGLGVTVGGASPALDPATVTTVAGVLVLVILATAASGEVSSGVSGLGDVGSVVRPARASGVTSNVGPWK